MLVCIDVRPVGASVFFGVRTIRNPPENQTPPGHRSGLTGETPSQDCAYRIDPISRRCEYLGATDPPIPGLSPEDCVGGEFLGGRDRIHPDDRGVYEEHFVLDRFGMEAGRQTTTEYRWRDDRGVYHWMADTRSFQDGNGGKPREFVGTLRDVTDWHLMIDRLAREEAELHADLDSRSEMRLALPPLETHSRAAGVNREELVCRFKPDGTISHVNEAYCRFFGLTYDSSVGLPFQTLVPPDDYSTIVSEIAVLSRENPSVSIENRVIRSDGETRWVEWTNNALYDRSGTLVEYQSSGRDVTERRNAKQLLAAQYEITSILADSASVEGAMRRILESIANRFDWDLVDLWVPADRPGTLALELACRPAQAARSLTMPRTGIPQKVLSERCLQWHLLNGKDRSAARGGGYRTVAAFPVLAGDELSAVIECFSRAERPRDPDVAGAMEAIGHQIGNYRERRLAENSLRKSAGDLEQKVHQRTEQLANALEALSNSELLFRTMIESAPMGIVLLNEDGVITERNQSLERMLGYPDGGLVKVIFESLVVPDDREKVREVLRHPDVAEGATSRVEIRFTRIDGDIIWGAISASRMALAGNERSFATVMIKDVTERKVIEEELRRSEEQFRTVFSEAPIGIALLDVHGRHVHTNQALNEMLRYDPGALEGKELEDVVHPADCDEEKKNLQLMADGRLHRYHREMRFLRADSTVAWTNVNGTAIRTDDGDLLYCLRIVEDITQKKETEQQMQMLAATLTSMNECVIITDATYRILSINKAFTRTFGFPEEEVRGRHVSFLTGKTLSRRTVMDIVDGTLRGGWTGEVTVVRRSGEMFPILLSTSVVREEHGSPIALVGIARDITEQKRLQQMLVETERRRSEDLRRFAVSVQHAQEEERQRIARELHDDICQRLSGMKLNMEVLEDEIRLTDRRTSRVLRGFRKQFEQTISEVRRLSSNLRPTILDDFGLTIAMNLLVRDFEKSHGIPVRLESRNLSVGRLDPHVEIALYRIAQESLTNIARHAAATEIAIRLMCGENVAELIVRDNGNGFDEASVVNARESGHGMGLISMRERAELLGGSCVVTSELRGGTTVHASIPLKGPVPHE